MSSVLKVCCNDCVGTGGWIEWVGEIELEEEERVECEICSADCSGIGCCSTHIGYFCGVCLADNENKCLDCGNCLDCGKTVCEVGATKQSCRIKAFWVKCDAEEDGVFILGDKQFDCAECIGCFENGKDYCKSCGFDMNIWNEKDEEEEDE